MKICKLNYCIKKSYCKGLCKLHYQRKWYGFKLSLPFRGIIHPKKRFWKHVKKTPTCWIWTGAKAQGYGQFRINEKVIKASRFSYEIHKGKIQFNLCVLHKCDNRACVRPSHLFLGTKQDNYNDMVKKGRAKKSKGSGCHLSKLNESQVYKIKKLIQKTRYNNTEIAEIFGVNKDTIRSIRINETWKHVIA